MSLKVPTIFTAIDRMTAPLDKMAKSMGAFGNEADSAAARVERRFRKIGSAAESVAKTSFIMGAAIAAPLVLAGKSAIDFEDKMADVAKVANVTIGSGDFIKLGNQAKNLGVYLGVGAIEAAGLMQNLAQGGVAIEDLDKVSKIAGRVGVAFGISADLAGEAFIKTRNALGGTIESTEKLMDTINFLGNTTAASSAQIITFMASGGSAAAAAAGASGEAVSAMGAQLISMGKSAEESATIMERFSKKVLMVKPLRKVFDAAGGGAEGMMAVIEKGSKMSGKAQDEYFSQFGEYGLSVQLLAKNFSQLEKNVSNATNAQLTADSVQKEFENRTNTTAFKIGQARAQIENLAIEIGSELLPVIADILKDISPTIQSISKWAQENKTLVGILVKTAAALAAVMLAVSGISALIALGSQAVVIFTSLSGAFAVMSGFLVNSIIPAFQFLWAAITVVLEMLMAFFGVGFAGFALIAAAVAFVVSLLFSLYRNWEMIVEAFKNGGIIEGLKAIGKTILDAVLLPLQKVLEIAANLTGVEWAQNAAASVEKFRADLGVNMGEDIKPINSEAVKQETLINSVQTQKQNVAIDINDKTGRASVNDGGGLIPVNLTSTFAFQ